VVLAAKAARIAAIDQAVVEIRDDDRFLADAAKGRALAMTARFCLLPQQARLAQKVFSPDEKELSKQGVCWPLSEGTFPRRSHNCLRGAND